MVGSGLYDTLILLLEEWVGFRFAFNACEEKSPGSINARRGQDYRTFPAIIGAPRRLTLRRVGAHHAHRCPEQGGAIGYFD